MKIETLVFNPIQENTYIAWDDTKECIIIDAGNYSQAENMKLQSFIAERGLKPVMAVNTHGHFDHTLGVEFIRRVYGVPFAMSSDDAFLLEMTKEGSVVYGMRVGAMPTAIDVDLKVCGEIKFGETTLQVIPTPGHTPGHVSLYSAEDKILITGDTLFRESIGRTDLPGGDYVQLMNSIIKSIIPLGDEVEVYPGHSETTTIGHESLYNPFIVEVLGGEIKYE